LKYVIFGGPLHGKSTAHKAGRGVDVEMLEESDDEELMKLRDDWRKREDDWKADRNVEDRIARNEAYTKFAQYVLENSDIPVVLSQYNEKMVAAAKAGGRKCLYAVLRPPVLSDRYFNALEETPDHEKMSFRMLGTAQYIANISRAILSGKITEDMVFDDIDQAYASITV